MTDAGRVHATVPSVPPAPSFPRDRTCPYRPPESYGALAADGPVTRVALYNGRVVWLVTGHAEARALLTDPRVSTSRQNPDFPMVAPRTESQSTVVLPLLGVDDPEHARQRRMLIPRFGLKRVNEMRPQIQAVVDRLLDAMLAAGPGADLVAAYSLPVPSTVICSLLGVPYADHDFFESRSRQLFLARTAVGSTAALDELRDYLRGLIARKEAEPGEGLLDELIAERLAEGEVDREELVMMAVLLLVAGHETTSNMISLGTFTLLEHPEELAALRADPALMPGAVEELLRFLSIADGLVRVAVEDLDLGGRTVRAGDGIMISTSVVNRDAAAYERPEALDVHRSARHHVAFGYGVHQCLGQNLARAELEIALTTLVRRIPTLRLAVPAGEVPVKPGDTLQGLFELPVTW
ncbi:cytochrome P450 [Streptomyces albireticuli]|uniref:Cytochrome P450 n=1 Tax=Streptomyces albireticuli TaxID=1940 RepID=A0A1Z2L074_9ACTN|nr:cytochrome P450 [Streptomyces albireticuli]ARZ67703.1 cytochrome P450 [Streptomyces albireticuli]